MKIVFLFAILLTFKNCFSQTEEFNKPWLNESKAIIIDPYEDNPIDWELLSEDGRVVAIIHRATIGFRKDKKYEERRVLAKSRGYKWGSYHLGLDGAPVSEADFYLECIGENSDEIMALDIEAIGGINMSLENAKIFIERIFEKTGRYPMLYGTNSVVKTISENYGRDTLFMKCPLWYARFKGTVSDFPVGTWETYTLWQFSSEINCKPKQECLYRVSGTKSDMDINVFNGSITELREKWPLIGK